MNFPFQFRHRSQQDDDTGELEQLFRRSGTNTNGESSSVSESLRQTTAGAIAEMNNSSDTSQARRTVLPLSMQFMKRMQFFYCMDCANRTHIERIEKYDVDPTTVAGTTLGDYEQIDSLQTQTSAASPFVLGPMLLGSVTQKEHSILEGIIGEYIQACQFYGCGDRINAGVLTTLRFSLPSMRIRGNFHDADMLALAEILIKYANGPLQYIRRLDFSVAANTTVKGSGRTPGLASHGGLTLSKVLQTTKYIKEILLERNRIGPYGATAIFIACSQNPTIQTLSMRRCRVGERGALTFAEFVCPSTECGLRKVDLSCNGLGYNGCLAIEQALIERSGKSELHSFMIDLDGNLVFQEVMNSVTHGLGVLLAIIGTFMLSKRVEGRSHRHVVSCAVYSTSLIVLYLSSTLYHSLSSLRSTQWLFRTLDKSAIYILIAGSYTPFLQIVLWHEPLWSVYLLSFLWICCFLGIWVEFALPTWKYRSTFSLAMYLSMGWSALVCLPEVASILPGSMNFMLLGGVAYTAGVPFFVRHNNLDHAVWHLFVLAGSIFHWAGIYVYVAPRD